MNGMKQQHATAGHYDTLVMNALARRSRHYTKLNTYGSYRSAYTITWMIHNAKGLLAFEEYPPGTFEAIIRNGKEVWFRRA